MKQRDERGELNVLLVPVIALGVLFIAAGGFAVWAFMGRQDYKNNVDQKIAVATANEKKLTQTEDAKIYAEQAKNPLSTYIGPGAYGSINIQYPRTWSTYVATSSASLNGLDVYFNPNAVPSVSDPTASFSLRVKVSSQKYDAVARQYATNKRVSISTYKLPKVDDAAALGVRVEGQITPNKQGVMIVLPLRDKTLQIWTESADYLKDLNNIILPNLTFEP